MSSKQKERQIKKNFRNVELFKKSNAVRESISVIPNPHQNMARYPATASLVRISGGVKIIKKILISVIAYLRGKLEGGGGRFDQKIVSDFNVIPRSVVAPFFKCVALF